MKHSESVSIFKEDSMSIVNGLEKLSKEGYTTTRKTVFQLHTTAKERNISICVIIISKYFTSLEPNEYPLQITLNKF